MASPISSPKISFVITARNDDFGGNFLNRIETSLRVLIYLTNEFKSNFELIIVEYNPPKDQEPLSKALKIKDNHFLPIRFITVPNEFHNSINKGSKNPLFEYTAKNIGIRRSYGEFILSTNADLIFSEELVKFLSQEPLDTQAFYRINRRDISTNFFDENMSIPDIYDQCRKSTEKIWTKNGLIYVSYRRWLRRFLRRPKPMNLLVCPIFNFRYKIKEVLNLGKIHDGAAGDFCLAHKNAWQTVRGFLPDQSDLPMDGYNSYMLACKGFKQIILPFPIFHINHGGNKSVRAPIDFQDYERKVEKMLKTKTPYREGEINWGFPETKFEEILITN